MSVIPKSLQAGPQSFSKPGRCRTSPRRHYKNLLEVEEAFCERKSYLQVLPVFQRKPKRVINHVRLCFLAYWISARLARQWRQHGETGEVTRILRQLLTIRLGTIHLKNEGLQILQQITKVPGTSGKARIKAAWAECADTAEHLVDSEFRPIYRLRLWSGVLQSFALKTKFTRIGDQPFTDRR